MGGQKTIGLVLTGGGARGAYQVGVLRRVAEICRSSDIPFKVICGVSSGAINGTFLGARAGNFRESIDALWNLWEGLSVSDVFRTDYSTLFGSGARLLRDLTLGGLLRHAHTNFFLDTAPLRKLLSEKIDFHAIQKNIFSNLIEGIALTATDYVSGRGVTFFDAVPFVKEWARKNRFSKRSALTIDHLMASSAIPIFFPPVPLNGNIFGDGGIRLPAPLSPAIHLGADKIFAISIRYARKEGPLPPPGGEVPKISFVQILGVLLNAVFLDALETDLERMERVNRVLELMGDLRDEISHEDRFRYIPVYVIRPSKDLGSLASEEFYNLPRALRYLLRGIGASKEKGWDLISYLAFEKSYTQKLLECGYHDAKAQDQSILEFLQG